MKFNSKHIERRLKNVKVYSYDCVDSTNKIAKKLAADGCDEGVVVCALEQTAGRGRLGRTFLSQKGGVYFSVVLRPEEAMNDVLFITVAAAVAAARAIEAVSGKKCDIKWVNDIYINNKKVCGILTEGNFGADTSLEYAILGVGINLFAPKGGFPDYLPLAGSVFGKKSKVLIKRRKKEQVTVKFINEFFDFYYNLSQKEFIQEYQQRSFLTGKNITYAKGGATYEGKVIGIDDEANLLVKRGEITEKLSHGEIQIIGMEQNAV